MEAIRSSETLVTTTTSLHGVRTQKATLHILIAMRTTDLLRIERYITMKFGIEDLHQKASGKFCLGQCGSSSSAYDVKSNFAD
jgi:hypothetical protein